MSLQQVTIVIPFVGDLKPVEDELDATWGNVAKKRIRDFLDDLGVVHFMSIHALPGTPKHHLVLELTLDGSADFVISQMAGALHAELRALLQAANLEADDLTGWLLRHRVEVGLGWRDVCGLSYFGTPGFTVRRILAEAKLAAWLSEQLMLMPPATSAADKQKRLRERLWKDQSLKWAFEPEPMLAEKGSLTDTQAVFESVWPLLRDLLWPLALPPAIAFGLGMLGGPLSAVGAATLTLATEAALLMLVYKRFRQLEESDPEDARVPDQSTLARCTQCEDQTAQNHLTVLTPLKPGGLRRFSLRAAFFTIRQAATHLFAPGKLSDISTIHFARWIVLPGTSQLLFFSNYGGSWDSYLEDFIIKAHHGLTGVWSNTLDFPKASNLFFDGATNGAAFKNWARRQQRPTRFWYSAYPTLTTGRIRTHAAIRHGIAAPEQLQPAAAQRAAEAWLALFGAPRTAQPSSLVSEQLPALVFGGLPRSKHSRALLLSFASGAEAHSWLARVCPLVSWGEHAERTQVFSLAWSARGLRKLGLDDKTLATFPIAFQENSAPRARKLGDTPQTWDWGNEDPAHAVDAIALLYGADEPELLALIEQIAADDYVCKQIELQPNEHGVLREPFGYVDGISQPILRGVSKLDPSKRLDQLIAPGEVVLGHSDDSGFTPRTPTIDSDADRRAHLPPCSFDPSLRDLGRDGTFLVVRQLHQDVSAFQQYLEVAADGPAVRAATPPTASREQRKEWVAAKLMGRWRNGTSLVRYPHAPGPEGALDNDFRYGVEDPDGLACPFGAHVRRANPRDSFDASGPTPLKISNRHRILRIGRVYQDAGNAAGMLFMCLNADIERQFEFIQQTWLRAPSFHGLHNEVDPMAVCVDSVAQERNILTVPTPHGPLQLKGLAEFVRVIGSGYFFMPGRKCLEFLASREHASAEQLAAE